jgi:hypothetical protein
MADGFGSLGSAYSILGQATTSEYNRRKKEEDDARKTARREARQDRMLSYFTAPLLQSAGKALTEGVTDLISGPIEEKYSEFFNSESYRAAKVQERQANRRYEADSAVNKQALNYSGATFGKGEDAYWKAQRKQRKMASLVAKDIKYKEEIENGYLETFLNEDAEKNYTIERDRHRERMKAGDAFKASGTVDQNYLNKRSKGIFDRTIDFFQGDDVDKQDARALELYEKSLQSRSMDAYINFDEAVKSGKSPAQAAKVAEEQVPPKTGYYDDFTITTRETGTDTKGNKIIKVQTATYNRGSEAWKNGRKPLTSTEVDTLEATPEKLAEMEKDLVLKANREFNYTAQSKRYFTAEAYDNFKTKAKEQGIDLTDIKTMKERLAVGQLFDTFDIEDNMKSVALSKQRAKERRTDTLTRLFEDSEPFRAAFDAHQKDPSVENRANLDKEIETLNGYYDAALLNKSPTPTLPTTTPTKDDDDDDEDLFYNPATGTISPKSS